MNRTVLANRRETWTTAVSAIVGLAVIAALVGWLWRPSKTQQAVPAPWAAPASDAAPANPGPVSAPATPAQARRQLAQSGRWSRLSAPDQAILAPLEEDWADLSFDQRLKWLDLALRFPSLSSDEQQRVQDRMAQWARMSPTERGAARLNFQEIRQWSHKDRLEQWEAYQGLNPDEKKELAVKAQTAVAQSPVVPRRSELSAPPVPKSSGAAAETVAGSGSVARPVGGTLVQAPIGATTRLVTQLPPLAPTVPPRVTAQPGVVDPVTLLPQARAGRSASPGATPATSAPTPDGTSATAPSAHTASPGAVAASTDEALAPAGAGTGADSNTTLPPNPNGPPAPAAPGAAQGSGPSGSPGSAGGKS